MNNIGKRALNYQATEKKEHHLYNRTFTRSHETTKKAREYDDTKLEEKYCEIIITLTFLLSLRLYLALLFLEVERGEELFSEINLFINSIDNNIKNTKTRSRHG
jgi:hypothetical protein